MRTLKLVVAYEGTRYVGWQRQANGVSIQALLEDALSPLEGGRLVRVAGAGRTDAGVHARGQVASCQMESALDVTSLRKAINARLPADVRVLSAMEMPTGFHARFWARGKTYAYHVLNAPIADPLARHFVWHVPQPLDLRPMQEALASLRGRHDFKAFQASGTRTRTTARTLWTANVEVQAWNGAFTRSPVNPGEHAHERDRLVTFIFVGDGFLRHMVRNLVGTTLEVGLGRRDVSSIKRLLYEGDRRHAGPTAPPEGLILLEVEYGDGPAPSPVND